MDHKPSATTRAVGISVVISIVIGLIIAWFAWPATQLAPRDLPVIVAGPAPAAAGIAQKLATVEPGAFKVTTMADAAAADTALRDREAYAAFVLSPTGVSLHTASGASPTVATLLTAAAQALGASAGQAVTIVDVVPGSPDDPRGAGFGSGFLPLVLAGLVAGILFALLAPALTARLLGLGLVSVLAGLIGAGVLHWMGVLSDGYLANAGAIALLTLAVSATVCGLGALLGRPGVALGVLTVFLFGNPISGVVAAPDLLPQPWGAIGQLLPPGAGATLLRSTAFFDGAGGSTALWTLVTWAVVGLILVAVGRARIGGAPTSAPAPEAAHVAV